jgi:hypothetical protein
VVGVGVGVGDGDWLRRVGGWLELGWDARAAGQV